jgi:hypothetical protein
MKLDDAGEFWTSGSPTVTEGPKPSLFGRSGAVPPQAVVQRVVRIVASSGMYRIYDAFIRIYKIIVNIYHPKILL